MVKTAAHVNGMDMINTCYHQNCEEMRLSMKNISLFSMPPKLISGAGSIEAIKELVAERGAKHVLVMSDAFLRKLGFVDNAVERIKASGAAVETSFEILNEPEIDFAESIFRKVADFPCDLIVAIGGGSVMDTAKFFSILYKNSLSLRDMLGIDKVPNDGVPTIMVPTTAGTGAEATPNAIVSVPEKQLKIAIVSTKLLPKAVILDPELTVSAPPLITATTGMDAFAHCIESFTSKKANRFSDAFAGAGMALIWKSLRRASKDGSDLEAREDMLMGAFFGGMAVCSSGTTSVHALAYPLGGKYKISHGQSNSMLLSECMRLNRDAAAERLKCAGINMGVCTADMDAMRASEIVVEEIHQMVSELKIPLSLRPFGITENDLDSLAVAAHGVRRLLDNNCKDLSVADIRGIYGKLL